MSVKKKKWIVPLLTVMVRGKPEEGVLALCKGSWRDGYIGPGGPGDPMNQSCFGGLASEEVFKCSDIGMS